MVKQVTLEDVNAVSAAAAHRVIAPTAGKRVGCYLAGGEAVLADASSRRRRSPGSIDCARALLIYGESGSIKGKV